MIRRGVPWHQDEDDGPKTISDCYMISFDIGENFDIPKAFVGKMVNSGTGFLVFNEFEGDDAIALYETLTKEQLVP